MASLELEKLTKRYPGVVSVDAIDLAVRHGEFVCLLGPSGCGKTTTLRMIAGFLDARRRRDPRRRQHDLVAARRRAARAAQHEHDLPELRGMAAHDACATTSAMALKMRRSCRRRARRAHRRAAQGREARPTRPIAIRPSCRAASSSASRWRARWRRSPTSCCSTSRCRTSTPICAARCATRSAACTTQFQYTSIYVTHDQVEAMTMADRIVVMNAGRIEQIGTPGRRLRAPGLARSSRASSAAATCSTCATSAAARVEIAATRSTSVTATSPAPAAK